MVFLAFSTKSKERKIRAFSASKFLAEALHKPFLSMRFLETLACFCPTIGKRLMVCTAPAQKIFREFFLPKKCRLPYLFPIEGIFPGVLEPESFRTHSWNKQAQRELACGGSAWIFAFATRIRAWIPTKNGADFHSEAGVDFVWIFSALFSLSQKIHAKSMPESTPKSTPILKTFFPLVFLGAQPWFTSLQLDARICTSIKQV